MSPWCPQTWLPACHLVCPGQACSSCAADERWSSLNRVCSPAGPPAPGRAACRRSEKCSCRAPSGWGPVFVKPRISSWSAWWSWPWPGAWTPRSTGRRREHPEADPRAWTSRRPESNHLEGKKGKSVQSLREGHANQRDLLCCPKKGGNYLNFISDSKYEHNSCQIYFGKMNLFWCIDLLMLQAAILGEMLHKTLHHRTWCVGSGVL